MDVRVGGKAAGRIFKESCVPSADMIFIDYEWTFVDRYPGDNTCFCLWDWAWAPDDKPVRTKPGELTVHRSPVRQTALVGFPPIHPFLPREKWNVIVELPVENTILVTFTEYLTLQEKRNWDSSYWYMQSFKFWGFSLVKSFKDNVSEESSRGRDVWLEKSKF